MSLATIPCERHTKSRPPFRKWPELWKIRAWKIDRPPWFHPLQYFSLSLSFPWIWTNLFRSLSLSLSLLGDSFGGGEYFVKKKKEKGNIWTVLKRWEGRRKMLGGEGEGNRESGKWKVVRGYIQVWRVERENFVGSIKLWNSCVEVLS